jgi:formate hydrogenlyase subunit 6/NADH:ubiquinone oxidoreductase subunit I
MVSRRAQEGRGSLYREEKYATYEIDMLRCIFCGDCEEACPKEAIFLTDRLVQSRLPAHALRVRQGRAGGADGPRQTRGCEQTPDAGSAEVQTG